MSLRDRLRAAASRRFVGRADELTLVAEQLAGFVPRWPVLVFHGPGGVGKSTLLERVAELAGASGVRVLRLDGRDVEPSPDGFLRALGSLLGHPDAAAGGDAAVIEHLSIGARVVLLVDTFERLQPIKHWLRDVFLPACPTTLLTVLAGRLAPSAVWTRDPLWHGHVQVVRLANLADDECMAWLAHTPLDEATRTQVCTLSRGHPLALALLVDIASGRGTLPAADAADVFRDLSDRFLAVAPSTQHRQVLEAAALLRRTTEEMLAHLFGAESAPALFDWLASLNIIERRDDGLIPHDLVRDAVIEGFASRDPERLQATRARIARHVLTRMLELAPAQAWPLACDYKFLFRYRNAIGQYNDFRTIGSAHFRPASAHDASAIEALVAAELTPSERTHVRAWLPHAAASVWVIGSAAATVDGVLVTVDLDAVDDAVLQHDHITAQVRASLPSSLTVAPGRRLLHRFMVARDGLFAVERGVVNALQMAQWYQWIATPDVRMAVLLLPHPAWWETAMEYFGFHALFREPWLIEGTPYNVYVRTWQGITPMQWAIEFAGGQVRADGPAGDEHPAASPIAEGAVMGSEAFAQAVREALKQVTNDRALGASPLVHSRIVRAARVSGERDTATLRRLLLEAAQSLAHPPRQAKFWRALELTYFRPAGTQALAAERLGLPFNTYRYQLSIGVERLIARLWDLEHSVAE